MSQIKLEHYKIFNEAAITLSFSKAARNLYISQSAVSQCITLLEKELDTQLFVRMSKGVTLTKEGIALHKKISEALSLITSAENDITNLKELKTGELIIGAGDAICQHFLIPYLVKFKKLYPQITIKVFNGTTKETVKMLKSGLIDLAFINLPYNDNSLKITPCQKIHDIFVSSKKDNHVYNYEELANKNLILLERESNSRLYIDKVFSNEGVLLHPTYELGAHSLLIDFAKNNLGISCIIKEFALNEIEKKEIYPLKINPPIKNRYIGFAHLSRVTLTNASLKFIDLII